MNQNSSKDLVPLKRTEANVQKNEIEQCLKNVKSRVKKLDNLLYQFFARNGPEALGMDKAEFLKRLIKISGRHRSWVNRLYHWILMEIRLELPHGHLKEYPARTLKTKVREDAWRRVLKIALNKTGSHHKITATDILAAAEELGCLKTPAISESQGGPSGCSAGGDEPSVPVMVKEDHAAAPKNTSQMDSDKPEASALGGNEAVGASDRLDRILAKLRRHGALRTAVTNLLSRLDDPWELVRELAALESEERSLLRKRLTKIGQLAQRAPSTQFRGNRLHR